MDGSWRTSTLNSHLSTAQHLLNRSFATQSQSLTGRVQQVAENLRSDDVFKGL